MSVSQPAAGQLVLHGDTRLRRVCREVAPDEDVADLAARLVRTMQAAGGVGLAAPQIGDRRRVLVCRHLDRRRAEPLIMVNPSVEARDGPDVAYEEGCLSFPGLFLTLRRPRGLRVRFRDLDGRPQVLQDKGLLARVVQHEIDHLDGVLFTDRLPRWRRWLCYLRRPRLLRSRLGAPGMAT